MRTSKNSGQDLEKYIFKEWKWCGKVGSEVHFRIKKIFWKGESKIGNEKYSLKSDQGNEDQKKYMLRLTKNILKKWKWTEKWGSGEVYAKIKKSFEKVKVNWEMRIRRGKHSALYSLLPLFAVKQSVRTAPTIPPGHNQKILCFQTGFVKY